MLDWVFTYLASCSSELSRNKRALTRGSRDATPARSSREGATRIGGQDTYFVRTTRMLMPDSIVYTTSFQASMRQALHTCIWTISYVPD